MVLRKAQGERRYYVVRREQTNTGEQQGQPKDYTKYHGSSAGARALISNANTSFITGSGEVTALSADILRLDQMLRLYGLEADPWHHGISRAEPQRHCQVHRRAELGFMRLTS
jgi:hypothetical protein